MECPFFGTSDDEAKQVAPIENCFRVIIAIGVIIHEIVCARQPLAVQDIMPGRNSQKPCLVRERLLANQALFPALGGVSSRANERTSEAGAGPVSPHAQPPGPIAEPHVHFLHFTLLQMRHLAECHLAG